MSAALARRVAAELRPDPARVLARLFLPGEEEHRAQSRAGQVIERVMALDESDVQELATALEADFAGRHRNYLTVLAQHAAIVAAHVGEAVVLSPARTLLLGASFTAEYATEGAALCNPSAVQHPDQTGLGSGQARVAISLRGIGEGHVSSIGFCSAVVGPGAQWEFAPRPRPVSGAQTSPGRWLRTHLQEVLADQGCTDELGGTVLHALPDEFGGLELEHALARLPRKLLTRSGAPATVDLLRTVVASAYVAEFAEEVALDQRVLMPSADEESHGMEDARFTVVVDAEGRAEYRATYTAYDGHRVAPRLLISPDLRVFTAHRLAGPAARNKGMALFPRLVNGRHLALCRSDGESTSLASSADGAVWERPVLVQRPQQSWEVLQIGNCGPPIETDRGWLVLTHGVGAMRTYSIGAILLDIDDPSRVVGQLRRPLLRPEQSEQDGYVPNVVYSCGAFLHDRLVWIPYGIDDARIGVAYVHLDELLAELTAEG